MTLPYFRRAVDGIVTRAELPPVSCFEDAPDKRIKIQFQLPPEQDTRDLLKKNGFQFRGGPNQFWVRKLDESGRTAARLVMAQLTERQPEDNQ